MGDVGAKCIKGAGKPRFRISHRRSPSARLDLGKADPPLVFVVAAKKAGAVEDVNRSPNVSITGMVSGRGMRRHSAGAHASHRL